MNLCLVAVRMANKGALPMVMEVSGGNSDACDTMGDVLEHSQRDC